jgi:tetraacyldisaccharide 4'-kinase
VFATAARWRRRWYSRHTEARRSLISPVISVGNLSVGGTGKTPVVSWLARWLADRGERPAILSRGYGRECREDGVVIVHDGRRLLADLRRAGDEPLMLARALTNVPVLVSEDRYLAGRVAEVHLGATVHLLDDGFQHLRLTRDIDLVVLSQEDFDRPYVVPAGRLREMPDALASADAILWTDGSLDADTPPRGPATFTVMRETQPPLLLQPWRAPAPTVAETTVLSIAATARPARFFQAVRDRGWRVVKEIAFRDHHRFGARDIDRIQRAASAAGAELVVTTEKDLIRLLPHRPLPFALAWMPLALTIEPRAAFEEWLVGRLARARRPSSA